MVFGRQELTVRTPRQSIEGRASGQSTEESDPSAYVIATRPPCRSDTAGFFSRIIYRDLTPIRCQYDGWSMMPIYRTTFVG